MADQSKNIGIQIKLHNDSIVYNIGRLYVLLSNYLSETYQEFGLNPAKFNLLMVVKHMGKAKGIAQIKLGDRLFVTASNITKLIDGLEKKGLVQRLPSINDRRVNLVKITQGGSQLLDKVWIRHAQALNAILGDLGLKDKETFNAFLQEFKKEMEKKVGNNGKL